MPHDLLIIILYYLLFLFALVFDIFNYLTCIRFHYCYYYLFIIYTYLLFILYNHLGCVQGLAVPPDWLTAQRSCSEGKQLGFHV